MKNKKTMDGWIYFIFSRPRYLMQLPLETFLLFMAIGSPWGVLSVVFRLFGGIGRKGGLSCLRKYRWQGLIILAGSV